MKNYSFIFISLLLMMNEFHAQNNFVQEAVPQIKNLLIYTSAVEINCEKEIIVKKGKNTIHLTELTPFIENNSVNVSISDPSVTILTVTEKINFSKEKRTVNDIIAGLQDSVKKMKKELGLISCKTEVLTAEKNLLFRGESIGGLSTQGVSVAEIEKASGFFSKRYYELSKDLFLLNEQSQELNDRIKRLESQQKESVTISIKTSSEVIVSANSNAEKKVKVQLRFISQKGGWAPMYDFKFKGATSALDFVFRANVFNATGTDWNEVQIKLSTGDPISGFKLPSLNGSGSVVKQNEGNINYRQIQTSNSITEYKIAHEYSIPSDAKPYLVDVDNFSMPATFNYLIIPSMDHFGFLMGKIPGWNKYNLLPATTNIYNHGSYMGKTFLNTFTDNDTLSIYLGKDQNVQCSRIEKNEEKDHYLIGNFRTEETKVDISVRNNSTEIIPIEVLEQVPDIDKESDEKLSINGIDNAFYNKKDAQISWKVQLNPSETTNIHYEYTIKTPKAISDKFGYYKAKKKKFRTISCPAF